MKIREALEREGIIDVIEGMADMRELERPLEDATLKALTIEEAEFTMDAADDGTEEYAEAVAYSNRLKELLREVE